MISGTVLSFIIFGYVSQVQAQLVFEASGACGVVKETTTSLSEVCCLSCVPNPHANPPRTVTYTKHTTSPSNDCENCFEVSKASDRGFEKNDWCVYYQPSEGKLNYTRTRIYYLGVLCTDSVDTNIATLSIKIIPNQPPTILGRPSICPAIDVSATGAGVTVYNNILSSVVDAERDPLFCSMTTIPPSDSFEIDAATCGIRAKTSLSAECRPFIIFKIWITDTYNPAIGPITVNCRFTNHAQPPVIPNLNTTVYIREDMAVGHAAYSFDRISGFGPVYTIFNVNPPEADGLFETNGRLLRVRDKLNYENPDHRNIRLDLHVDNGHCPPVYHYLDIRLIDVNDRPVLTPKIYFQQVDEDSISVNPGFRCEDEDTGDICRFSIATGNEIGKFKINKDTGEITSTSYYLPQHVQSVNHTLVVSVIDKGGMFDTATVNLNIRDINDHRPYFLRGQAGFSYTVTECDSPGLIPATLQAFDADSAYQGNNLIAFQPVSDSCLQIHPDGKVVILKTLNRTEVCSLSTKAVDQGSNPQQLTSQVAVSVTVSSTECPPATQTPSGGPNMCGDSGADVTTRITLKMVFGMASIYCCVTVFLRNTFH